MNANLDREQIKDEITFNAETHTYSVNGRKVPSVTQILQSAGLIDFSGVDAQVLERAANFGKAVHKATELLDKHSLDFKTLDPALAPYIEAWQKFKFDYKLNIVAIEKPVYNSLYRYCGTIDRVCQDDGIKAIIDIKTGHKISPVTALQTAGYAEAIEKEAGEQIARLSVLLKADGSYAVETYSNRNDFNFFFSAVNLWWWRKNNNLLKGGGNEN